MFVSTQRIRVIKNRIFLDVNRFDNSNIFITESRPCLIGIDGYNDLTSAVNRIAEFGNDLPLNIRMASDEDWQIVGNCGKSGFSILFR